MNPIPKSHRRFKTGINKSSQQLESKIKKFRAQMFLTHVEEARVWIENIIQKKISINKKKGEDFLDVMKTCEYLAILSNTFVKRKKKIYKNIDQNDRMHFMKCMNNYQTFVSNLEEIGFPNLGLFSFEDLYKRKNVTNVISCVHVYANYLVQKGLIKNDQGIVSKEDENLEFTEKEIMRIENDFKKIEAEKGVLKLDFAKKNDVEMKKKDDEEKRRVDEEIRRRREEEEAERRKEIERMRKERKEREEREKLVVEMRKRRKEEEERRRNEERRKKIEEKMKRIENMKKKRLEEEERKKRREEDKKIELEIEKLLLAKIVDPKSFLFDEMGSAVAGKECFFLIKCDEESMKKVKTLDISILSVDGNEEVIEATVERLGDQLKVSYTCKNSGEYVIKSKVNGNVELEDKKLKVVKNGVDLYSVKIETNLEDLATLEVGKRYQINVSVNDLMGLPMSKESINAFKTEFIFNESKIVNSTSNKWIDNGLLEIDFFCPIAGNYELSLKTSGLQVPSFPISFSCKEKEKNLIKIEFLKGNSSVVQFKAQMEGEEPRYISLHLKNQLTNKNFMLSDEEQGNLSDLFRGYLLNFHKGINAKRFIKSGKDSINDYMSIPVLLKRDSLIEKYFKGNRFKDSFKFESPNEVIDIKISNNPFMLEQRKVEPPVQYILPINQNKPKIDLSAMEFPSNLFDPNKRGANRRLFNLNFWIKLFREVNTTKSTVAPSAIDVFNSIKEYSNSRLNIKEFSNEKSFYTARKIDVLQYGNLLLQASQKMIFKIIEEVGKNLSTLRETTMNLFKGVFPSFQEAYMTFRYILENTNYLEGRSLLSDVAPNSEKRIKDLIECLTTEYLTFIQRVNITILPSINLMTKGSKLKLKYVRITLKELYENLVELKYDSTSEYDRKILVQEILIPFPPYVKMTLPSKSFVVNIPINVLFDKFFFKTKRNISTKNKKVGKLTLKNPWKSCYVRHNRVVFEAIRSGMRVASGLNFLRVLAANHVKRFSRVELLSLQKYNISLEIPTTFLSLVTPFYFKREDRDVFIYQNTINEAIKSSEYELGEITVDLHDDKGSLTVPIKFLPPILLNYGVNVVIKTFQLGIGIQRALNNRQSGVRRFELSVQNYMLLIRNRRKVLRDSITKFLQKNLFQNTQVGDIYRNAFEKRIFTINNCYLRLEKLDKKRFTKCNSLDTKLVLLQKKLDTVINTWMTHLDAKLKMEWFFQKNVKKLVNEIMSIHQKIYKVEEEYHEIWKEESFWMNKYIGELEPVLQQIKAFPPEWKEYKTLVIKQIDINQLYVDFKILYHTKKHESFDVGYIKSGEVKKSDPYDIPVRISLLSFALGNQLHITSKSGGARVASAIDQALEYTEMRYQFGQFPSLLTNVSNEFHNHRKLIHSILALNGSNTDISRYNSGIAGNSIDGIVGGRFHGKELYRKYLGCYYLAKTSSYSKKKNAFNKFKAMKK